ncbi:MAG: L,D-transpeptidase [Candidatus Omnitrophica bacterium]|jgi:lipoprotein-anchoring transpeptidase ErfK/SrfK|nr:L,D-transpeptidase [Candidatus Omnitrophota bacterium]
MKTHEVDIDISAQRLYLRCGNTIIKSYPVSTSKYGIGNREGSNKTPLGLHQIVSKIGRNAPLGAIFKYRRKTGKIARVREAGDLITTRILRLAGLEKGVNKGRGIDSFQRCIYIHGTPEENLIGKPASHGCIRMKNRDIIKLFNLVRRNTLLYIHK